MCFLFSPIGYFVVTRAILWVYLKLDKSWGEWGDLLFLPVLGELWIGMLATVTIIQALEAFNDKQKERK